MRKFGTTACRFQFLFFCSILIYFPFFCLFHSILSPLFLKSTQNLVNLYSVSMYSGLQKFGITPCRFQFLFVGFILIFFLFFFFLFPSILSVYFSNQRSKSKQFEKWLQRLIEKNQKVSPDICTPPMSLIHR